MNKSELANFISSEHCVTRYDAKRAIDMVTDSIIKIVGQGNSVEIIGFGSFVQRHVATKNGVNPQTREKISISAYNKPTFKAGKKFKDACN